MIKQCPKCQGEARFSRTCAAYVCDACGTHVGLVRCWCGWAADGGDGRAQLQEAGETIDPEDPVGSSWP